MKKFFLSFSLILIFSLYVYHEKFGDEKENVVIPQPSALTQPNLGTSSPTPVSTIGSRYKNGSYIGDVADAYYGNIQVKVTIAGGKIADVQFLQYPNDRSTSIEINQQAMPYLKQEAIQAQDYNVDIVSGATQSSEAFRQSLKSALDQARS